ncbi:MAG: uroporphyrinogen-III synthase [Flavobacteriaceae bacterium TMED184]|nr:MAG: uroporphyrinogen-III synthase [Flavobacteriaceae bacterium TMED184]|tara:strand:- start:726 stop:1469 length:744 start_codon:yes stop_codon:yes gene_type:complete
MKVKTILVSQPEPSNEKSPYARLKEKYKLKIDFRPFIHVEGMTAKDVRQQKINFSDFNNIILTSKNSVDHFFRLAQEMRYKVPDSTKYFCQSEAIGFYLQKYVVYRKRKIYVGDRDFKSLESIFQKFENESFLLPTSDILNSQISSFLDSININCTRAQLYKTVVSDLSDLRDVYYDILVFFSPSGIESLFKNFPDFKQNKTRIAIYGDATDKAASEAKLRIDIKAPTPDTPSMTMAIEKYISQNNK